MGILRISSLCVIFLLHNPYETNAQLDSHLQDLAGTTTTTEVPNNNNVPSNYSFRICVPFRFTEDCEKINRQVSDGRISCVYANDKIGCIEKVGKNEADFVPLQPEEIYVASRFSNSAFNIFGEIRSLNYTDRDYRYEPVAVIRNSANIKSIGDLKGKKTCHTGFGRNAGWKVPFSHLLDKEQLSPFCDEIKAPSYERDLYAMSKYFGQGCVPGPWVLEKDVNKQLMEKYSNLCQLCENSSECNNSKSKYNAYESAVKCLTDREGDVAWTKMDAVQKVFNLNSTLFSGAPITIAAQFSFLCWDGSSRPLTSPNPCSWAKRPWGAYLVSALHPSDYIQELLSHLAIYEAIQDDPSISTVLELNSTKQQLHKYEPTRYAKTVMPLQYLNLKNYTVTIEKPSCPSKTGPIRYCVTSELEKLKCVDLKLGLLGQRVVPKLQCVLGTCAHDCFQKIKDGNADVVAVSPKEAAYAKKKYGLTPLLSVLETIDHDSKPEPYKYALAVVKKDSPITNLTELNNTKACFGSITNLGTWNTPLRKLYENKLVENAESSSNSKICSLSTFFNATCAPGAKDDPQYGPFASSLCELCIGDSTVNETRSPGTHCANSPLETYYGDLGALKCLDGNVADVAFIDHTTVLHLLQDPQLESKVQSYQLLCPNGDASFAFKDYMHCNWGKVPSNVVVSRDGSEGSSDDEKKASNIKREDARMTLRKAAGMFSPSSGASIVMNLFGPYYGNPDLMFPDNSEGLTDYTTDSQISQDIIDDLDPCTPMSSARSVVFSAQFSYLYLLSSVCTLISLFVTKNY